MIHPLKLVSAMKHPYGDLSLSRYLQNRRAAFKEGFAESEAFLAPKSGANSVIRNISVSSGE
jgi:hypothetical protein